MPRLKNMKDYNFGQFVFTAVRPDSLDEPEYTIVNIVTDMTGSVELFADQLLEMEKQVIRDAQRSPYGKRLIVRLTRFNNALNRNNQNEVYGFKAVGSVDVDADHLPFHPSGATPLIDATYDASKAVLEYSKELYQQDYNVNGLVVIITDGEENASHKVDYTELEKLIEGAVRSEMLDSFKTILIGINTQYCATALQEFKDRCGIDQYVDAGEVKEGTIGKIGRFISQSISSASQALGTGSPSQNLTF